MFERRAHIRIPVGLHGRYQAAARMAAPRLGMTRDISFGGMQLACTERLQPGERVAIDLPLPRQGEVGLTGVVLWSRKSDEVGGFEAGLQWDDLDLASQARLNAYISGYSRTSPGEITAAVLERHVPVSWPRVVGVAVLVSALLITAAQLWIIGYEISLENQALRASLAQQQFLHSRP